MSKLDTDLGEHQMNEDLLERVGIAFTALSESARECYVASIETTAARARRTQAQVGVAKVKLRLVAGANSTPSNFVACSDSSYQIKHKLSVFD